MQNIRLDQIIAVLGMCVWFMFPIGMIISLARQNNEALPTPDLKSNQEDDQKLKIFEHKKMIYNDEIAEYIDEAEASEEIDMEEYNRPHAGIGATHVHEHL
ncbi:MAG: hypothetical protein Q7U04_05475 [Bacteriovorax sp.]|nr:hypothetical protein [Bacteriovorax sp.]